jgi:hypothetical protein
MSEWPMRGHFRYLRFKTFPMTPRTPQCEVFCPLLSSFKHLGVPEDSKPPTFPSVGLHPYTWPKWGCDTVYLQHQPNDTLDTSFGCTILRIKVIKPLGVLELQGPNRCIIEIIPKIVRPTTCRTWILPSSRWLGFLHLIIHVRYVRGHMMLIGCCFANTIMVDTTSSASS